MSNGSQLEPDSDCPTHYSMKNNLTTECHNISVYQKAAHLNNRPFIPWSKHKCLPCVGICGSWGTHPILCPYLPHFHSLVSINGTIMGRHQCQQQVASFCTLSQVRLQQTTTKIWCLILYSIGQDLRCWKRGQNRQEEASILCYRGNITRSNTLHPHGNCVEVLQIKVLSIIFVYTNLSINPMWLFC